MAYNQGQPPPPYNPHPQYYPPPPGAQQKAPAPVVVRPQQQSITQNVSGQLGGAFASAIKSGGSLLKDLGGAAKSAGQGFENEWDRTRKTPLLDCFSNGSGLQLKNRKTGAVLRVLPDGSVDGRGTLGNDYACHFLVVKRHDNQVILRSGAFPQYHLANANGHIVATGTGDRASHFRLHQNMDNYVTLRHEMTNQYIGIDDNLNIMPAYAVDSSKQHAQFDVVLVWSPTGHIYSRK